MNIYKITGMKLSELKVATRYPSPDRCCSGGTILAGIKLEMYEE